MKPLETPVKAPLQIYFTENFQGKELLQPPSPAYTKKNLSNKQIFPFGILILRINILHSFS